MSAEAIARVRAYLDGSLFDYEKTSGKDYVLDEAEGTEGPTPRLLSDDLRTLLEAAEKVVAARGIAVEYAVRTLSAGLGHEVYYPATDAANARDFAADLRDDFPHCPAESVQRFVSDWVPLP